MHSICRRQNVLLKSSRLHGSLQLILFPFLAFALQMETAKFSWTSWYNPPQHSDI